MKYSVVKQLCCILFYGKMKITATNEIEQKLIKLFEESKNKTDLEKAVKAQNTLNKIIGIFKYISIFDNVNHMKNVNHLYFNKKNIKVLGIRKMSQTLHMDEKTLFKLRKRYCEIAITLLEEYFNDE